jgi:hypothetical protein
MSILKSAKIYTSALFFAVILYLLDSSYNLTEVIPQNFSSFYQDINEGGIKWEPFSNQNLTRFLLSILIVSLIFASRKVYLSKRRSLKKPFSSSPLKRVGWIDGYDSNKQLETLGLKEIDPDE